MKEGPILLCEDSPYDVELTCDALARVRVGNAIDVARDGAEALDYLFRRGAFSARAPGNPVLVLLDLKMPRVDGLEVLRAIRGDAALKTIPVVVLTSSREEPDVAVSYQLGVNAYVVKPVDAEQFVDAVGKLGLFWLVVNEPPPVSSAPG